MTGAAGALLPVHLRRCRGDLGTILVASRAGAALGQLVAHHALQDVGARLEPENIVRQIDVPAFLASSVVTSAFITRCSPPCADSALLGVGRCLGRGALAGARSSAPFRNAPGSGAPSGSARFTASRNEHPATLGAGNGTADHDQPALDIGLHHPQILRRDADVAHVAGHLLALEHLAGVLALAGRADGFGG